MAPLNSIENIISQVSKIEKQIEETDYRDHEGETFGSENEYSYKTLISGLNAILLDIKALTKQSTKFLKYSTYNERNQINDNLSNLSYYFHSPSNILSHLDALKILIRPYNIRFTRDRFLELDNELETLTIRKLELEESTQSTKETYKEAKELISKINEKTSNLEEKNGVLEELISALEERKTNIEESLDELAENISKANTTLTQIEEKKESVNKSKNNVEGSEKLIDSFVSKVQEREKAFENVKFLTDNLENRLVEINTEHISLIQQATTLINDSKTALGYTTATGLSSSFQNQYNAELKSNPHNWIWGAGGFLACALGIGIWLVLDKEISTSSLIGRITMLPLLISGAIFCANIYVKRINVIQDYAYKMVLAQSIVGFSEQLKKHGSPDSNDEYAAYIKKVLEEIHQDPLRRTTNNNKTGTEDLNNPLFDTLNKAISTLEKVAGSKS